MGIIASFTWIEQVILIIGCIMGCLAAIDSNFKDAIEMPPLTYNGYVYQVVNRYLFFIGIMCCLLAYLTADDKPIISLIVCLCALCLMWFFTFVLLRSAVSIIRWCQKK